MADIVNPCVRPESCVPKFGIPDPTLSTSAPSAASTARPISDHPRRRHTMSTVASPPTPRVSAKSWPAALVLSLVLGTFGADRFYLGHLWLGLAKLLTFGGLGIWWLVDLVLIAFRQVHDSDGRPLC